MKLVVLFLFSNHNHAVSEDFVLVLVAFLKFLDHNTWFIFFTRLLHNRIVKHRIKFLALGSITVTLHPQAPLSAACRSSQYPVQMKTPYLHLSWLRDLFQIINHRKDLQNEIRSTDFIILFLLLVSTFSIIIKFCHLANQTIFQFFDLCVFLILLIFLEELWLLLPVPLPLILSLQLQVFGVSFSSAAASVVSSCSSTGCSKSFSLFWFSAKACHLLFFLVFLKYCIQLCHHCFQIIHNLLIIHTFRSDNTYRSLYAFFHS